MSHYYQSRIPEDATKVFTGVAHDVYQWQQGLYDGSQSTFEIVKRQDAAVVVAIKGDKIVMLKQQQPLRPEYWSVPAGHMEREDASPEEAARRELLEETGMSFRTLKLVEVQFIGNNRLEWYAYRYVAYDLESEVAPTPGAGEKIEIHEMSLEEAQTIARDSIFASPTVLLAADTIEGLKNLPEVHPLA